MSEKGYKDVTRSITNKLSWKEVGYFFILVNIITIISIGLTYLVFGSFPLILLPSVFIIMNVITITAFLVLGREY